MSTFPPQNRPPGPPAAPAASIVLPPTKKKTRVYLLVAIVLAALAGVLVVSVASPTGGVWVYTANKTISPSTPLRASLFTATEVSSDAVVGGAYRATSESNLSSNFKWQNFFARYPISKNSQLTSNNGGSPGTLNRELKPGERLLSISANQSNAVGGNLRVGDTVDIYGAGDLDNESIVSLLVTGVKIVDVSLSESDLSAAAQRQASDSSGGTSSGSSRNDYLPGDPIPGTYTVVIQAEDVNKLAAADLFGTLFLSYRSPLAESVITAPLDLLTALCSPTSTSAGPKVSTNITALATACLSIYG